MDERKIDLIESGMKLFAHKGYHKTSIQEIATDAGISKGAFYLYFNSKEEFIAIAIQYFHTQLTKEIINTSLEDSSPKDRFSKQINIISNYIYEHRDFIIMHFREDMSMGDNAVEIFQQMKIDHYHWLRENVCAIYGDKINLFLIDIIIQIEGLISGYFKWIVIDDLHINRNRIGPYILRRLDSIVQGMIQQAEKPLIPLESLPEQYQSSMNEKSVDKKLTKILFTMKEKIARMNIHAEKKEQLQEVVEIFSQKVTQKERQNILIQGLLAHFTSIAELKNECEQIAKLLQIELLE